MQVFKFGGASVKDAPSVENVLTILKNFSRGEPTLMVISAMGKTTNLLEKLAEAYYHGDGQSKSEITERFFSYHQEIRDSLNIKDTDTWKEFKEEFLWEIEQPPVHSYDYHYDQIVSKGELASSHIISEYMNASGFRHVWVDARDLILTDDHYREGKVDFERSMIKTRQICEPLLQENGFILTQGFIGATNQNTTTTLGREGSDYSAALFSYFLDARQMVVWKDVPGILNADPRYFKKPLLLKEISYYDAIEMTYYGATVIHPKTIRPLQNKKIPLFVKSFLNPDAEGTKIFRDYSDSASKHSTYIYKPGQILISVQSKDFSFISEGLLSTFFSLAEKHHIKIHLMQNSAMNFSICTDYFTPRVNPFLDELKDVFRVAYNTGVGLLTIRSRGNSEDKVTEMVRPEKILLVQKTRNTAQFVIEENNIL